MASKAPYFDRYPTIAFERDDDGVLVMRLHSDGGPVDYAPQHHEDWVGAFYDVGRDPDNRVVIITGTGDEFINRMSMEAWGAQGMSSPGDWEYIHREGKRLMRNLIDIEAPMIGAINGPATIHAELAVLSDLTVASSTATFADLPHFPNYTVPGDGAHIVWTELLGSNRGRYFLITGQILSAEEAQGLGVINEIVPPDQVLPRARELAQLFVSKPPLVGRYTRQATTLKWKRLFDEALAYGLALEGLGSLESIALMQRQNG